jgi:hypothetical protein
LGTLLGSSGFFEDAVAGLFEGAFAGFFEALPDLAGAFFVFAFVTFFAFFTLFGAPMGAQRTKIIEMRSVLPLAVFAASGCDLAFGLGGRVEPDAAPIDVLADALDATPCTESTGTVVALEDTMLIREANGECDPSNRFGTFTNVNIGQPASASTRSRVLLRFSLTSEMVTALTGGAFVRAELVLPLGPLACAGACPSTATGVAIYAVHNDWNEGANTGHVGASWCMRKQPPTTMWEMQGGDGVTDRSKLALVEKMVTTAEAAQSEVAIPFDPAAGALEDLPRWITPSQQLSLIVIPTTTTGTLYTKAREDSANGGGARLSVTACR